MIPPHRARVLLFPLLAHSPPLRQMITDPTQLLEGYWTRAGEIQLSILFSTSFRRNPYREVGCGDKMQRSPQPAAGRLSGEGKDDGLVSGIRLCILRAMVYSSVSAGKPGVRPQGGGEGGGRVARYVQRKY